MHKKFNQIDETLNPSSNNNQKVLTVVLRFRPASSTKLASNRTFVRSSQTKRSMCASGSSFTVERASIREWGELLCNFAFYYFFFFIMMAFRKIIANRCDK